MKTIYHFSGAGNDFVVIDGREGDVSAFREVPRIEALCKDYKTDGLMILGMPDQVGHDGGSTGMTVARPVHQPSWPTPIGHLSISPWSSTTPTGPAE